MTNSRKATALGRLTGLSYAYPGGKVAALAEVNLEVEPGMTLLAGSSGGGKSTLLRVLNGLVPHFHGGTICGSALVGELDVLRTPTRRLAREVGFVFQDPEAQFISATVEREVAFGLENLGMDRPEMRTRVGDALAAVGASALRGRLVASLSGGERQRISLAAAMALRPTLVALDEPISQLDPIGAAAVVEACLELMSTGTAVIVSEHRLERLLPIADRLLIIEGGRLDGPETPELMAVRLPVAPAIVDLGRRLGWSPVPLEVAGVGDRLPGLHAPTISDRPRNGSRPTDPAWAVSDLTAGPGGLCWITSAWPAVLAMWSCSWVRTAAARQRCCGSSADSSVLEPGPWIGCRGGSPTYPRIRRPCSIVRQSEPRSRRPSVGRAATRRPMGSSANWAFWPSPNAIRETCPAASDSAPRLPAYWPATRGLRSWTNRPAVWISPPGPT